MRILNRFNVQIRLAVCVLAAVLTVTGIYAQVSTGTILGTITDSTGAVVPGAKVTVTNVGTNVAHGVDSSGAGLYAVPNLQPGRYKVDVSAATFSPQTVENVVLDVGEQRAINISLKVGEATEKVVVQTTTSTVDLESSTVQPVVDEQTIVQLPLNGRDWASLAVLQPGVASVRTQSSLSISNQRANRGVGNQITASGARPQMNNYRLDGISINDYSNGGPSETPHP